jgi:hypothetical protein
MRATTELANTGAPGPALQRGDPGLQHEHRAVEVDAHHLAVGLARVRCSGAISVLPTQCASSVGAAPSASWQAARASAAPSGVVVSAAMRTAAVHIGQALGVAPDGGHAAALGVQLATRARPMPPLAPVTRAMGVMFLLSTVMLGMGCRGLSRRRPALHPRPAAQEESVAALHHPRHARQAAGRASQRQPGRAAHSARKAARR